MQSIADALNELQTREAERDEYRRFYRGAQGVHLQTPELRRVFSGRCGFSLNFCKTIIESLTDRVQVSAVNAVVSIDDDGLSVKQREEIEDERSKKATAAAREVWERSALDVTALAWRYAVDGDAWIGMEAGIGGVVLKRLDGSKVVPLSDTATFVKTSDTTGQIHEGATVSYWELGRDGEWRMVREGVEGGDGPLVQTVTDSEGNPVPSTVERIRNGEDDTQWGASDLAPAVPQQRAINQRVIDMHEVSGNAAWPQRWIVGQGAGKVAGKLRSRAGAIHGLEASADSGMTLQEFAAADPTKIGAALKDMVEYLSITTGTPLQAGAAGANASAESRRIAQDKLTRRVGKAIDAITVAVSRLLESALLMEGIAAAVTIDWESPEPIAAKERLEEALMKLSLGVSRYTLLAELGYDPDREAMLRAQERAEDQVALTRALTTGTDEPADLNDLLGPGADA